MDNLPPDSLDRFGLLPGHVGRVGGKAGDEGMNGLSIVREVSLSGADLAKANGFSLMPLSRIDHPLRRVTRDEEARDWRAEELEHTDHFKRFGIHMTMAGQ
jgi:hypothetical protein